MSGTLKFLVNITRDNNNPDEIHCPPSNGKLLALTWVAISI